MIKSGLNGETAIGIDLGTTYSCVAVWHNGKVKVIANENGARTTPSYVAFTDTDRLVGDSAKIQVFEDPENCIFDAKRLIGRKFYDEKTQEDMWYWPFKVLNIGAKPVFEVEFKGEDKRFTPEEVSAMILGKMKEIAEAFLGYDVHDAVITVPAYFNDAQRQATKDAGEIAGLNVIRIMNEPTAAALAYGLDRNLKGQRNILIFDLGGGTFDVSILTIDEGTLFEVKATAGDTHLGGQDFDNQMLNYFVDEFLRKYKKDLGYNAKALWRLRAACERAKRTLSFCTEASIELDALHDGIDFYSSITRATFEDICCDLFQTTMASVEKALFEAKMDKADVHEIVLVGGSTRIPKIQALLQHFFDGKELNNSINPDEAVACGAAVKAAILSGDRSEALQDVLLVDVAPMSLGIETAGGVMSKMIERNCRIPCRHSQTFTTFADNQEAVTIDILEGERTMAKDDNKLGTFSLTGIPRALRGVPQIKVTFDIDANGILNVSAKEAGSGKQEKITILNDQGRLSKEEIQKMVADATTYRMDDCRQKERVAARHGFERYILAVKRVAWQAPLDRLGEYEKLMVNEKCMEMISWLKNNEWADMAEIKVKFNEVQNTLQPLMLKLYAAGGLGPLTGGCAISASAYMNGDGGNCGGSHPGHGGGPTVNHVE